MTYTLTKTPPVVPPIVPKPKVRWPTREEYLADIAETRRRAQHLNGSNGWLKTEKTGRPQIDRSEDVLAALRTHGPMTAGQIVAVIRCANVTAAMALEALLADGKIAVIPRAKSAARYEVAK
ncbi:MAG: hypothetical protein ACEQSU_14035 [Microgenomates group bacterium]